MQIIINRISLLMLNKYRAERLKWAVAVALGLINISVFCIWIPAQLQISDDFIQINHIWDRIEKVIFLFIDAGLNFYFIYLVRAKLIANGLSKYMPLFRFNALIVGVSMGLDVSHIRRPGSNGPITQTSEQITLIGVMSLPNAFVYVGDLHPVKRLLLTLPKLCSIPSTCLSRQASHRDEYGGSDCQSGQREPSRSRLFWAGHQTSGE